MALAVIALFSWMVVIVFAVVPKKLTLTDFIFIYFVCVIVTITLFTVLDVNLQWVPTTRDVEKSFALHICRFIEIPLMVILSANLLQANFRSWRRWALVSTIFQLTRSFSLPAWVPNLLFVCDLLDRRKHMDCFLLRHAEIW